MSAPVAEEPTADARSAWAMDPGHLMLVGAVVFALLGLLALASAIDLPSRDTASQGDAQRSGSGFLDDGRIDLGNGQSLDIRPIPGCPDGFSIGEDIYVVPDPEACGFEPLPPGARGFDSGKTLLTPSLDGDIGGFRIGPNGEIQFLPPGLLGPNDFMIGELPDGSFGLTRPDGSRVDIAPGDDGLSLRDRASGEGQFIPGDGTFGQGDQGGQGGQFGQGGQAQPFDQLPPSFADPERDESRETNGDDEPTDWSSFGPVLLVIAALLLVGFLILAIRKGDWRKTPDDEPDADEETVHDTVVSYAAEIDALDRLLWEIDQEPDPRTAIRRVYAALETGLDNPSMARKRSETPGIYLRRVLGHFSDLEAPLQELTNLFEQARFSEHEITPAMRDRAVTALVAVRGHYAQASVQPPYEPAMSL